MYFNPIHKHCDQPSNVVCHVVPPKQPELDDVMISCPPSGQHFYPHPTDCSAYFVCHYGASAIMSCGPLLKYDFATQSCDLPEKAKCITEAL